MMAVSLVRALLIPVAPLLIGLDNMVSLMMNITGPKYYGDTLSIENVLSRDGHHFQGFTLPVPDTADTFSSQHRKNALSCILASSLSYERPALVKRVVQDDWGVNDVKVVDIGTTQAVWMQGDDFQLVAFRGTELFGVADWYTNLGLNVVSFGESSSGSNSLIHGKVHSGFYEGISGQEYRKIYDLVSSSGRPLFLTGHSLGGALAQLCCAFLLNDNFANIGGVYTFGQPATGDAEFSSSMRAAMTFQNWAFIFEDDLVPRLPLPLVELGPGRTVQIRKDGSWTFDTAPTSHWESMLKLPTRVPLLLRGILSPPAAIQASLPKCLWDHFPQHYADSLQMLGSRL